MEQTHQYSERRWYLTQSGHHSHRRLGKRFLQTWIISKDFIFLVIFLKKLLDVEFHQNQYVNQERERHGIQHRWGAKEISRRMGKRDRSTMANRPHGSGVAWGRRFEGYLYYLSCNLTTLKAEGRSSEWVWSPFFPIIRCSDQRLTRFVLVFHACCLDQLRSFISSLCSDLLLNIGSMPWWGQNQKTEDTSFHLFRFLPYTQYLVHTIALPGALTGVSPIFPWGHWWPSCLPQKRLLQLLGKHKGQFLVLDMVG